MSNNWSKRTDFETVKKRAGGRRHYNSVRRLYAVLRKNEVALLFAQGVRKAEIARRLGVHRSTVSRDVKGFFQTLREEQDCPVCGHKFRPDLLPKSSRFLALTKQESKPNFPK
ncbi:helix-turn-helix domain-containing protein, partial [candidate division KSB1 bacterium]|nr:helix-turn-helix domain-containing protein [candidate division KSB1 bacterium]NIS25075.1 helix-turn-helix domain-containing protein [candidate division KSB1 bacterium]NIT71994.1 helix-turn-helix domain-containing protein [candidate division KSB1 bacterium]NIU25776.1 helix-turn-helix domain-containing protein [candidate division KSB1 bacterium]NIU94763.1 helix-turn-helix domain-containing protein [candidate division KSB1 bacterium]